MCVNTACLHLETETGEEGLDWEGWGERLGGRECIERLSGLPWLAKQLRFLNPPVRHLFFRCLCRKKRRQHSLSLSSKSESCSYLIVTECGINQSFHKSCVPTVNQTGGIHLCAAHGLYSGMSSKGSEAWCPGSTPGRWW